MRDLVTHAVRIIEIDTLAAELADPWDPILGARDVRKQLRKAAGRGPVSALASKPGAGVYFAGLRLLPSADLDAVTRALGVDAADSYETLLRLVTERLWPSQVHRVPDAVTVTWPFVDAVAKNDQAAAMRSTHALIDRVWSGATPPVVLIAPLFFAQQMIGGQGNNRFLIEYNGGTPWETAPDGWVAPATSAQVPPTASPAAPPAAPGSTAMPTTSSPPTSEPPGRESPLQALLDAARDTNDPQTRDLSVLALQFGFSLADRLAGDIGIVPEGPWETRVVTIGYCAALPALAEAFDNDELLSAPLLIDAARRVDVISGDGALVQLIAQGQPEQLLAEATVRLKEAYTTAGVDVPDAALALFPIRLAASAEMARQAADGIQT